MPFDSSPEPERGDAERCEHLNRLPLELDQPAIREILTQHAELFEGMKPDHAYICFDCQRVWLAFPL